MRLLRPRLDLTLGSSLPNKQRAKTAPSHFVIIVDSFATIMALDRTTPKTLVLPIVNTEQGKKVNDILWIYNVE